MTRLLLLAGLVAGTVIGCTDRERTVTTDSATAPAKAPMTTTAPTDIATNASDPAAASDVTGGYFAMDALPAEFAEIDHLLLATIDENAAPAPLNGFLRPKAASAADYVLVQPALHDKHLTFTTTTVNGIQYAFDGAFEVLGNFAENPPGYETPVLVGTLSKMRDGKTIATTPVRFRYEAGG